MPANRVDAARLTMGRRPCPASACQRAVAPGKAVPPWGLPHTRARRARRGHARLCLCPPPGCTGRPSVAPRGNHLRLPARGPMLISRLRATTCAKRGVGTRAPSRVRLHACNSKYHASCEMIRLGCVNKQPPVFSQRFNCGGPHAGDSGLMVHSLVSWLKAGKHLQMQKPGLST